MCIIEALCGLSGLKKNEAMKFKGKIARKNRRETGEEGIGVDLFKAYYRHI